MSKHNYWLYLLIMMTLLSLRPVASAAQSNDEVHVTFIHLNDVYEILPVSGGLAGGVARVATLKRQLQASNPNTFLILAGDYHGPSGMGLAKVNGEQLAGKQSVAVLNKVGIDYATYGDHEFDIYPIAQHLQRHAETTFPIVSSNVFTRNGASLAGVMVNDIFTVTNAAGAAVRIGLFGITEPFRATGGITYTNAAAAAAQQVSLLNGQADIIVALTHQSIDEDRKLALAQPDIDLILGGDEHEYMKVEPGAGLPTIYKSDSNARNIQIIDLYYNPTTGALRITDRLQAITSAIADDPTVKAEADRWTQIAFDAFRAEGIEPTEVVGRPTVALDGYATSVRNRNTELTHLLLDGLQATAVLSGTVPELSIFTGGFIRLDDVIPAGGSFTQYDILRTFPVDVKVVALDVKGDGLQKILDAGQKAKGTGPFLLTSRQVSQTAAGAWLINGQPLDVNHTYRVGASQVEAGNYAALGAQLVNTYAISARGLLIQQLKQVYSPGKVFMPLSFTAK